MATSPAGTGAVSVSVTTACNRRTWWGDTDLCNSPSLQFTYVTPDDTDARLEPAWKGAGGCGVLANVRRERGHTRLYLRGVAGSLPTGTTLNASTGLVSGTPTTAGSFCYTIKVTDGGAPPQTATLDACVPIAPATLTMISICVCDDQSGRLIFAEQCGERWNHALQLYAGLRHATGRHDAQCHGPGTVSGTPTTAGGFSYAIKVTDSGIPARIVTNRHERDHCACDNDDDLDRVCDDQSGQPLFAEQRGERWQPRPTPTRWSTARCRPAPR